MTSARDLFTEVINADIDDKEAADRLNKALIARLPSLQDFAERGPSSSLNRTKKQLESVQKGIRRLQDAINSCDGDTRSAMNITQFFSRFDRHDIDKAGDRLSDKPMELISWLWEELILANRFEATQHSLSELACEVDSVLDLRTRRRGQPVHRERSVIIERVAFCFRESGLHDLVSTENSSLFYRVVTAYLDEVSEKTGDESIRDDNLTRTLRSVLDQ